MLIKTVWQEIAFRPEMAMNQLITFWLEWLLSQKIAFRPEMAFKSKNCFSARNGFLPELAVRQKLLFSQKYFCQIWSGFLARHGFLARNGFLQTNLPYFSKYWKVWLAFNGWKLSGLFFSSQSPKGTVYFILTSFDRRVKRSPPRKKSNIKYSFPSVWKA